MPIDDMKPYYQDDWCTIYHGDCRDVLPQIGQFDLVLTDPPYGIERFKKGFGYTRFKGHGAERNGLTWDNKPNGELLRNVLSKGKQAVIWGANNFDLPESEYFLVWDKEQTVDNFASAELAYSNLGVPAKIFRYSIHRHNHTSCGFHPTQKPIQLMTWCIGLADNPQTILDPFMGSGSTLRAAKDLCINATGIEIEERYCEIAANRLRQEVLSFV